MNARAKKFLLLLLAAALLASSGQVQKSLNRDRDQLGLTMARRCKTRRRCWRSRRSRWAVFAG